MLRSTPSARMLPSQPLAAADTIATDRPHRHAGRKPGKRLCTLVMVQLRRTAKPHTALLGPLNALAAACTDQATLEFGKAGKHSDQQLPMRRAGVAPGIGDRPEFDAPLGQIVQYVQEVSR